MGRRGRTVRAAGRAVPDAAVHDPPGWPRAPSGRVRKSRIAGGTRARPGRVENMRPPHDAMLAVLAEVFPMVVGVTAFTLWRIWSGLRPDSPPDDPPPPEPVRPVAPRPPGRSSDRPARRSPARRRAPGPRV